MVAFLNQGKCSSGTSNSSASRSSQKPCFETCVTSATEVVVPGILNFHKLRLDYGLRGTVLALRLPPSKFIAPTPPHHPKSLDSFAGPLGYIFPLDLKITLARSGITFIRTLEVTPRLQDSGFRNHGFGLRNTLVIPTLTNDHHHDQ